MATANTYGSMSPLFKESYGNGSVNKLHKNLMKQVENRKRFPKLFKTLEKK